MEFEVHTIIHRPLEDVFSTFRDMHQQPRRGSSVVPVYDKITPGDASPTREYLLRARPRPVSCCLPRLTVEWAGVLTLASMMPPTKA